jgi:hypothetical protein
MTSQFRPTSLPRITIVTPAISGDELLEAATRSVVRRIRSFADSQKYLPHCQAFWARRRFSEVGWRLPRRDFSK